MKSNEFREILFDAACVSMACDGHIAQEELKELEEMLKSAKYFKDLNLSNKLENFTKNSTEDYNKTIEEITLTIKNGIFNFFLGWAMMYCSCNHLI